jgi:hypothetical protein
MKTTFAYHRPSPDGIKKIAIFRREFSDLADLVEATVPACRERSIVITKLEEAAMWLNKAVIITDPASVIDPDATFGAKPVA